MAGIFGPQELCRVVGKEILGDRKAARRALRVYGHRKGCRRVYFCVFCESYHMTKDERGKPSRAR